MNKESGNMDRARTVGLEASGQHLQARHACEDLIFRSFKLIDEGRANETRKLFIDDGVHTLNGQVFQGLALTEFFKTREAMVERRTRHCVANITFSMPTERTAEASYTSVVYVLPQQTPGAVCDIRDTFTKQEQTDGWLLARRDVLVVAGSR
jgi:hypothetical protein